MIKKQIAKIAIMLASIFIFFLLINMGRETSVMKTMSNKEKAVALIRSLETGDKEPLSYVNAKKYKQHNLGIADGLEGLGNALKNAPPIKANVVRAFEDGEFVFLHTEYDFFGPKIGFDIFRFEDGLIVEHWDNLQETVTKTKSGRTMIDGDTEVKDLDKTDANKELVKNFIDDIFLGDNFSKVTQYISSKKYYQHNPMGEDSLEVFKNSFKKLLDTGTLVFDKNHIILGEGNFVLAVTEGKFLNKNVAFYDLFRIEDGYIVEHWDTIEEIPPKSEHKNNNGKFNF